MSCPEAYRQAQGFKNVFEREKDPKRFHTSVFQDWRDNLRSTFENLRDKLYLCRGNKTAVKVAFIVFFLAAAFLCVALVLKLLPTSTLVYGSWALSLLILLSIQYMCVWRPTPLVMFGLLVFILITAIAIAPFLGVLTQHDFEMTLVATASVALIGLIAAISVFYREK
jgi:hypothetical protein